MMKRILLSSALLLSGMFVHTRMDEKIPEERGAVVAKIAVVDFQEIFDVDPKASPVSEWGDAMAKLEKELKPRLEKIQDMQARFQRDVKKLREQGKNDADAEAELMKLENDIQVDAKAYQAFSQKEFGKIQGFFAAKVNKVAEVIALKEGWTLVLALVPGQTLYVSDSCNITDKVIAKLNEDYRAEQRVKKFSTSKKVEKAA